LVSQANVGDTFDSRLYNYYARYSGLPIEEVYNSTNTAGYLELMRCFETLLKPLIDERLPDSLDVGCGHGQFVFTACSNGWNARGIDLSESAIQVGKSFGVPIEARDVFDRSILPDSFDLVTMFEFIEHLSNPGRFLKRAETIVRPGGIVYITTPNFDSLERRIIKKRVEA
jgi:2-polyprenyl-3-methyl-5-hydroxy-6-metoxy-1,4-benzoquinol methylase